MKCGTEYAKRVRQLFQQFRRQYGKPVLPDYTDPLEHLIFSILLRDTTESKAQAAWRRLRESVVDQNELRVTPCVEVAETLRPEVPDADTRARQLIHALNAIYDKHSAVDLGFLREKPVREAREYLRSLPGVDEFTAARVVLFGLGGHAVPLDAAMLEMLRKEKAVDPDATREEVQSFLERHIPSQEAAEFFALAHRYAAGRYAKAVSADGVGRTGASVGDRPAARGTSPAARNTAPRPEKRPSKAGKPTSALPRRPSASAKSSRKPVRQSARRLTKNAARKRSR